MKYDFDYLISLNPREFSNLYKLNLGDKDLILKTLPKFIHEFVENRLADGESLFLSGSDVLTPNSIVYIQVVKDDKKTVLWRQIICGKNWISLPNGSDNWYSIDLDRFESALFDGMTRCKVSVHSPLAFRRCFEKEMKYADMLDYILKADDNDGEYELNESRTAHNSKKALYENIMNVIAKEVKKALNERY